MANPIVQQLNSELENLQKELAAFKSTVTYLNNAKGVVNEAIENLNHSKEDFKKELAAAKSILTAVSNLTEGVEDLVSRIESIDFPERLDKIGKTVNDTVDHLNDIKKATLEEIRLASVAITKADFEGRFKSLQQIIDTSVESNNNLASAIEKQKLPEKIDSFGKIVIDKLEAAILNLQKNTKQIAADTAKSIQELNLPVRIDKLDANVAGILRSVQNLQARVESIERNINDKIAETAKAHHTTISTLQEKINIAFDEIKNIK